MNNENQPTSACCGAEIETFWRGGGWVDKCRKCKGEWLAVHSQPPASKGEGWKQELEDENFLIYDAQSGSRFLDKERLESFIQTAIDEAVEETKQRMSCLSGICDKCHRRIQCERVLNPHSPQ